ncbi:MULTISPECIES: glycine cleavage system protein H [Desulfobacula]|uniref:Glycine cleavage system H protein (Lipoate-binding) n=2 Tax=Desulfobacula TaxID=28222 RepID=A0A1H2GMC2_9BACT|nr:MULTISPECIES: glycine cleavage system protein H [Desulfobacula]CCK79853.1 putative glycine cleavage system H protein [Desulfobacula toluolica Tol2]SDU20664.1 Glycine cleavage system H protein (lipoate-binding) [Desulfobacula phenolica]
MIPKKQKNIVKGFQVVENDCIWMKSGIVSFKLCDNAYDCRTCPFDKAMQKKMNAKRHMNSQRDFSRWAQNLENIYKSTTRPCRHSLTGRVHALKTCLMNYECYHCAYDQMLDEEELTGLPAKPSLTLASGYRLADGYYYHMGHTWARFEHGGRVTVGFDDFMVKLFGPPSKILIPPIGTNLKKDHAGLTFSRSDKTATALSPVTGNVLAVNIKAKEHPEIVHEDPYHEGWLCILEPNMPKRNHKGLFYGKESLEWTDRESQRLLHLIEPEYMDLAATGGEPVDDIYGSFPEIEWEILVREFLRTKK